MIPYLLLLLIPIAFALTNTRQLSLPSWYFTFFIYVLFVGLRFDVGPDAGQYVVIHQQIATREFWELVSEPEPLSHMLFWISETVGLSSHLSNVVAAIIMIGGAFAFARRTVNPWLALLAATPYFIIVIGMSGIRQAMAAGVMLFLFSRWERQGLIRRGLFILISAMFHTSALINNIFLIIKLNIALRYKLFIGFVVLLLTLYLSLEVSVYSDNVLLYQERYLRGDGGGSKAIGSIYHILMIAIPALLGFVYKRRILQNVHSLSLLNFGLYASIGVFIINAFSNTVASRLTVYLYFVPMMVYPALVASATRGARGSAMMAVILVHVLILIGWFQLANVSFAYIPYKNLLIDD